MVIGSTRGTFQFIPGDPPADPAELRRWLRELVSQLQSALTLLDEKTFRVRHVEPVKKWDGLPAHADGTSWNPGSGKGLYIYKAATSTWVLVASL